MKILLYIYAGIGVLCWAFVIYKSWSHVKRDLRESWINRISFVAFLALMITSWPWVILRGFMKFLTKID